MTRSLKAPPESPSEIGPVFGRPQPATGTIRHVEGPGSQANCQWDAGMRGDGRNLTWFVTVSFGDRPSRPSPRPGDSALAVPAP